MEATKSIEDLLAKLRIDTLLVSNSNVAYGTHCEAEHITHGQSTCIKTIASLTTRTLFRTSPKTLTDVISVNSIE